MKKILILIPLSILMVIEGFAQKTPIGVTKQALADSIASRPRLKSDGRFDYAQPKGTYIWKIPTLDESDQTSPYINHNDIGNIDRFTN